MRFLLGFMTAIAIGWYFIKPSHPDVEFTVIENPSEAETAEIADAVADLIATCPGIEKRWREVAEATAALREAMPYRAEAYGWTREVLVDVKLKDGMGVDYFAIGLDGRRGVVAQKTTSQARCPMPIDEQGADTFIALKHHDHHGAPNK